MSVIRPKIGFYSPTNKYAIGDFEIRFVCNVRDLFSKFPMFVLLCTSNLQILTVNFSSYTKIDEMYCVTFVQ